MQATWNDEEGRWEVKRGGVIISTHSSYLDAITVHPELRTEQEKRFLSNDKKKTA